MAKITDFENLINKLKKGTLTNKEIADLLEYLKDRDPKTEIVSLFQRIWDESSDVNKEIDSKWISNQVLSEVSIDNIGDQEQKIGLNSKRFRLRKLRRIWLPIIKYAAVFIIAFSIFWFIRPVPSLKESVSYGNQFQRISVPYGSKTKVELPDGSVIVLNSGSILTYSSDEFNSDKRSILLEGEGFFTVNKDQMKPFYVTTSELRVKVIGTTFNIKAYPEEKTEEATLITGSVEIYAASDIKETKEPILLKPNEKVVFNKSSQKINEEVIISDKQQINSLKIKPLELQHNIKTEQVIAWKDNRLIFDNELFSSLTVKIERWFDVHITVNYPELNHARFSGKFDKETVEQVITALSTITPFRYEIRKNQITIVKK